MVPQTGNWFIQLSSTGNTQSLTILWGNPAYSTSFVPVPADYDGDGRTDIAVWARNTGEWFVLTSRSGFTAWLPTKTWGLYAADPRWVPVPGDYDGDKKADYAVWSPLTGHWRVWGSATNTEYIDFLWGNPAYGADFIPAPGDFDGDGRVDPSVWLPATGTWYVMQSSTGYTTGLTRNWGLPLYGPFKPVVLDIDGDGKADFGLFRPATGTWYVLTSSTAFDVEQSFTYSGWGLPGDIPQPGTALHDWWF